MPSRMTRFRRVTNANNEWLLNSPTHICVASFRRRRCRTAQRESRLKDKTSFFYYSLIFSRIRSYTTHSSIMSAYLEEEDRIAEAIE